MPDEDLDTQDPLKFKEEFDKAAKSSRARTNFKTCSDFCDKYIEKMTPNDSFSKNDDYDRDKLITEIYNDTFFKQYAFIIHYLDFTLRDVEGLDIDKANLRRKKDQLQVLVQGTISDRNLYQKWETEVKRHLQKLRNKVFSDPNAFAIDKIPDDTWFDHDRTKRVPSNSSNAYLALKRLSGYSIAYDEWEWKTRINYDGKQHFMNKLEARRLLWPVIRSQFGFELRRDNFEDGLDAWSRKNTINSRKEWLMGFLRYYDNEYDYISTMIQVLNCDDNEYGRDVAHMILAGTVQRAFFPGCILKRIISLINEQQNTHRSTFCKVLACGSRNEADLRWFTDRNIFDIKNEFTRLTIIRGVAVFEFAERTGMSRFDLDHYKNEISSTVDTGRIMRTEEPISIPRAYDIIATTNRTEILYDTQNVREFPLDTGIVNNDLFVAEYPKIMGRIVHGVLYEGWSGAPSKDIMAKAYEIQDAHLVESDLTSWLKLVVAFTHISGITEHKFDELVWAFRISRTDYTRDVIIGGVPGQVIDESVYVTDANGLSTFAAQYRKFHNRSEVRIDKNVVKDSINKVRIELDNGSKLKWQKMGKKQTMRATMLSTSLRGWFLKVPGNDLPAMERFVNDVLFQETQFIQHLVGEIFERPKKGNHIKN